MKEKENKILRAMGYIEDEYIEEAVHYHAGQVRKTRHWMRYAAAAAVVAVMLTATSFAFHPGWRAQIRQLLGVSEQSDTVGYQEFENNTVQDENTQIQLLSEYCNGNQMIVYFSITPVKEGAKLADKTWYIQYQSQEFADKIVSDQLNPISETDEEIVMQLVVNVEDLMNFDSIDIRMYQLDESGNDNPVMLPVMTLPITQTPVLEAQPEAELTNDVTDASGIITDVTVSSGHIELNLNYECFETWCSRVCLPDGGKSFMEGYYGDWTSQGEKEDGAYFSAEDEQAIAKAYSETWKQTMTQTVAPTVEILLDDGTSVTLSGEPETDLPNTSARDGYDPSIYRWRITPVIDLDHVTGVKLMGQTYSLQ